MFDLQFICLKKTHNTISDQGVNWFDQENTNHAPSPDQHIVNYHQFILFDYCFPLGIKWRQIRMRLCKQFGPSSGPIKCLARLGSQLFGTWQSSFQ